MYMNLRTAEMPVWTNDGPPPSAIWEATDYGTGLEPYVPFWAKPAAAVRVPYAQRVQHEGKRRIKAAKGSMLRWAHSKAREAGDFLWGAFQPVKEAW